MLRLFHETGKMSKDFLKKYALLCEQMVMVEKNLGNWMKYYNNLLIKKTRKMKKLHFFSMVCVLALVIGSLASCNKDENGQNNGGNNNGNGGSGGGGSAQTGYVDLGLPSGTKWKASNETGGYQNVFYTYDEAVSAFGDNLPTKEQLEELKVYCTWEWQNNGGYKVTGTNGNSIVLPAAGIRFCDGGVYDVGSLGCYWSSTPYDSESAWYLYFNSGNVGMNYFSRCYGFAVRLVQD